MPIRSGIINTINWFALELLIACLIDSLLCSLYNRSLVRKLEGGESVLVQESRIPLVGRCLFANIKLNYAFILVRILVLLAFLAINLGIDGTDVRLYEKNVLHSRMEQRSVADGQTASHRYERPYAQLHHKDIFVKCIENDINNSSFFTVYEPAFNLTIPSVTLNVNITELIVQALGSLCIDGVLTRERKVLLRGELIPAHSVKHPMRDGELYQLGTQYGSLGLLIFKPGDIITVTNVTQLNNKLELLNRTPAARFVSGHCIPQRSSKAKLRNKTVALGQAVSCLMVFEYGDDHVFFGTSSWLNNIFEITNGVVMRMGSTVAIQIKVNKTKSKTIHKALAIDVLTIEPSWYWISMLASVLKFHYSATMDQIPFQVDVHYDNMLATKISVLGLALGALIIALFLALAVYHRFAVIKQLKFTLNNIDGLSKLLILLHDDNQSQVSRLPFARLSYNGSIQISSLCDRKTVSSVSEEPANHIMTPVEDCSRCAL